MLSNSILRSAAALAIVAIAVAILPSAGDAQPLRVITVQVKTNMPESMVYADSVYIGRASDQFFSLPLTVQTLRLVPPNLDSWALAPLIADLREASSDSLVLDLRFKYHYRIESVPYDAQVFLETPGERTLLGDTPLLSTFDDPLRGMLLVTKSGYEPLRLTPGEKILNRHYVSLAPVEEDGRQARASWLPGGRRGNWVEIVAGGIAIASGVAAIRFKTKADRRYARYEITGDPALRPGFERFDRYAAVALGTMQVGIGVLAVRLVIK